VNGRFCLVFLPLVALGSGCSDGSGSATPAEALATAQSELTEVSGSTTGTESSPATGAALPAPGTETSQTATATPNPNITTEPSVDVPAVAGLGTPNISFVGTSIGAKVNVDELIYLDASDSSVDEGEIVSYQWEQIGNGQPSVDLLDANTATASFLATEEINASRLHFRVTVNTSQEISASSDLFYAWHVEVPEPVVEVVVPVPEPVVDGHYVLGQSGEFYAMSAESIYVANQVDFSVDHVNPHTDTVIESFPLLDMPTLVEYVEATNSLYVGAAGIGVIEKIDLDTGAQTQIGIDGEVKSMAAKADRLYFTTESALLKEWDLQSIASDDSITAHGIIKGDLILPNPVSNEIIAVLSATSPAKVYRYSFDAADSVTEEQMSADLGSNASDLAISSDGVQLAVAAGSGNGAGYTIHDISSSDLTVSSGAWDSGAYPTSADFSDSQPLIAASNGSDLLLFSTIDYTLVETRFTAEALCGLNYYNLPKVQFSDDGQHVFAKLDCGFYDEKTVLFFYKLP